MRQSSACPNIDQYQLLTNGKLEDAEQEAILEHLECCDSCAAQLHALPDQATLAGLVRNAETLQDPSAESNIARLVERLSKLRPEIAPAARIEQATPPTEVTVPHEPASQADRSVYDFLASPQAPDELGRLGPYRVLQVLGVGGMGVVFRAEDPHLERPVALKAMLPALAASESAKERFKREARAAAKVKHDHIVTIHQVGEDRGVPFLAMEFLEGEPLDTRLEREGKLPLAEVLRIGRETALGLAAAHKRGLIHRDIKPANIWLEQNDERGMMNDERKTTDQTAAEQSSVGRSSFLIPHSSFHRVKILDFGLARASGEESKLTQQGAIVGTPAYMAPEQAQGKVIDHRCDLFSLGCVLYRMATGVTPFKGTDMVSTLMSVATETPTPPVLLNLDLPADLSDFIMQLLAKNPAERPTSAQAVAETLERIGHEHVGAGSPGAVAGSPDRATIGTEGLPSAATTGDLRSRPVARPGDRATARGPRRATVWRIAAGVAACFALAALVILWGTGVFRLKTSEGTIVVEGLPPGAEIHVDGEKAKVKLDPKGQWIEIQAAPGKRKLLITAKGFSATTEDVVLGVGERKPLHIRLEPLAVAKEIDRSPSFISGGDWRMEGDELVQAKPGSATLFFGDPAWTDYDVVVEARTLPRPIKPGERKNQGGNLVFRARSQSHHLNFSVGAYFGTANEVIYLNNGKWGRDGTFVKAEHVEDRWYKVHVQVRGPRVRCWLDDQQLFDFKDERFPSGGIGLGTVNSAVRWRNLRVLAPDGNVLWEGFPELPSALAPRYKNSLGMEFALVPKGKSWIGGGGGKVGDKEVEFKDDFYLGVYEVTQEEWEKVLGSNPSSFKMGKHKRLPVETVSWDDCQTFIKRLNEQSKETGWVYRLPTEAEWEYACRGGPGQQKNAYGFDFYFDQPTNVPSRDRANFELVLKRTCTVGAYPANRLGLHDMHGNVWEWCGDTVIAGKQTEQRLLRGGGWGYGANGARAASRYVHERGSIRDNSTGLRVARVRIGTSAKFTNSLGMEFVLVPKGKSWLGGDGGRLGNKEVEFKEDFYLGVYETTQEEWEKVMGKNPSHFKAVAGVKPEDQRRFPVEQVSWDDAQAFIKRLNEQSQEAGWVYRLPTELEWEYACRGGPMSDRLHSAFDFYFEQPTNNLLPEQMNFEHGAGLKRTCKVGSYPPNKLGLYDMHGNVWEWCAEESNPKDPKGAAPRAIRGGAWRIVSMDCRAAFRVGRASSHRSDALGLRVARVRAARPDYEDLAIGRWVRVIKSEEDFKRLQAAGAFRTEAGLPPTEVRYAEGVLDLAGAHTIFRTQFTGKDMIARARVKKLMKSGTAGLRIPGERESYHLQIVDNDRVDLGQAGKGTFRRHGTFKTAVGDEYVELALAAIGDRITGYLDGKKIIETRDTTRVMGGVNVQVWKSRALFKDIEVMILDGPDRYTNSLGMEFALIPKGKAWLGGGGGTVGNKEVEFEEDFYLGVYEVTQEEWAKVMAKNNSFFSRARAKERVQEVSDADLKRFPVDTVNWDDVQTFLKELNAREKESGWVYRLPTQAEWEYACRGGPMTDKAESAFDFYLETSSTQLLPDQANFGDNLKRTCKVGSYKPNRLGLYDMHGNVLEWCNDDLPPDPKDPKALPQRVLRGGCWSLVASFSKAVQPVKSGGWFRHHDRGLRVARVRADNPPRYRNSLGMEFALVPKGKAWLGGSGGKAGDREVEFKEDFYLGVYEVTQGEWEKVMGKNPSTFTPVPGQEKDSPRYISVEDWKRFPVETVTWADCQEFIKRLNAQVNDAGWIYRLPKEDEWEYACRGGPLANKSESGFDYYFNEPTNLLTPTNANFKHAKGLPRTNKVGSYRPNRLGLYDMHGNVSEWCDNFVESQFGPAHAVRSGSWAHDADGCRATSKGSGVLTHRMWDLGLRVARVRVGTPSTDPDRRAAEWVLSIGGTVGVNQQNVGLKAAADLPREPFRLTSVDLQNNKQVSDEGLACFSGCKNLRWLNLPGTGVSDAGLAHFKDCKNLQQLDISSPRVTDAGLANFKDCRGLTWVWLVGTQVGDDGLAHLRGCKELAELNLAGTRVTDASLVYFKDWKNLKSIALAGTQVSDKGLAVFKGRQDVLFISLGGNTKVSDVGLENFKDCKGLRHLWLDSTRVTDAALAHFKDCRDLTHVWLNFTEIGDAWLKHLRECKGLTAVHLQGTRVSDAGLGLLAGSTKLEFVNVAQTKVSEASVKKFAAALPGCKIQWEGGVIEPTVAGDPDRRAAEWVLSVGGGISINGERRSIKAVGDLPTGAFQVTGVGLYGNENVSDARLAHLKDCKFLKDLEMRNTQVSDAGLVHFKDCISLHALALGPQVSDSGLAYFKDCKKLEYLNLHGAMVTNAGLAHFKDCKNLRQLLLSRTAVTDAGLALFEDCKNLATLDLSNTKVSDAGLARAKNWNVLDQIVLFNTQVTDGGLAYLAACPKLRGVNVKKSAVTLSGVKKLSTALPSCRIEWDGGVIEPANQGFVPLFNNKDFAGWDAANPKWITWKNDNGTITGVNRGTRAGTGGSLFTQKMDYADFHFRCELLAGQSKGFKVMFRHNRSAAKGSRRGYAVLNPGIDSKDTENGWGIGSLYEDIFLVGEKRIAPSLLKDAGVKPGEWYRLEIIARGEKIEVLVNGVKSVEYTAKDPPDSKGAFGFGCPMGARVAFRNVEVKELAAATAIGLQSATRFANSLGMEFALVPKGKAWLGGGGVKPGDREVEFKEDFYLGVYEITQEEWEKVMGKKPSFFSRTGGGKDAVKDMADADLKRFPVENVSWDDTQAFLDALNRRDKQDGWVYRLPTEAEWEYACRGGPAADRAISAFSYYFDAPTNEFSPHYANVKDAKKRTMKVGSYKPNRLGLYDMHGNVWEWCQDEQRDPRNELHRVFRGGAWNSEPNNLKATSRSAGRPVDCAPELGLRVARVRASNPKRFANSLGMEFARVPKGKAWLGGGGGKPGTREVEFKDDFYLGVYEVTQDEWQKVLGANPSAFSRNGGGKNAVKDIADADLKRFPVDNVTWNHAQAFLKVLNQRDQHTGWIYRLPTEDEWEYACRGGPSTDKDISTFDFYLDKPSRELSPEQANFGQNLKRTCKVGSYQSNRLGFYDMHGNVLEWTDTEDFSFPDRQSRRSMRGGSWLDGKFNCRAVLRNPHRPTETEPAFGLRVARVRAGNPPRYTNSRGMEFVLVPKGKAWLGGGGGKPGTREVEFKDDFYLGVYEVTQEEWQKMIGNNPSSFSRSGRGKDAVKDISDTDLKRFPIENVSRDDAEAFIAQLNLHLQEPGWTYRLPTLDEWEYACRGGPMADPPESAFHFYLDKPSNQITPSQANFLSVLERTCKVGSYRPNRLGLYDMHGNVWEWCSDSLVVDHGMFRGGGWNCDRARMWASRIDRQPPRYRNNPLGLRVARVRSAAALPGNGKYEPEKTKK